MSIKTLPLICFILSLSLFGCPNPKDNSEGEKEETTNTTILNGASTAIALWDCGLREEAGKSGKWITSISFGETVEMLGDTVAVEAENRTYFKVKLSDGQTGWSNRYLFAQNGQIAAITIASTLYKRPDLVTMTDTKLEFGEVVAIEKTDGDWLEVVGKEKKKKGWINGKEIVTVDELDIAVAVLRARALNEGNLSKKQEKLSEIINNPGFKDALFYDDILLRLNAYTAEENDLEENELMISGDNVNIRSTANTEEDNKLFQLNYGDVCVVLEQGAEETVGDNEDYWYKISYQGQEGWVFGTFTSRSQ